MSTFKYIFKIILVLYIKYLLVSLWIGSIEAIIHRLQNPDLTPYLSPLGSYDLYMIFLSGNILFIPWLVLWCKRLPLALNKPKVYYRAKAWIRSKKEQALIYKVIINSLVVLLALCLLIYIIIAIGTLLALTPYFIYAIFHYIFYFRSLFI